jgi:hypothetical protein
MFISSYCHTLDMEELCLFMHAYLSCFLRHSGGKRLDVWTPVKARICYAVQCFTRLRTPLQEQHAGPVFTSGATSDNAQYLVALPQFARRTHNHLACRLLTSITSSRSLFSLQNYTSMPKPRSGLLDDYIKGYPGLGRQRRIHLETAIFRRFGAPHAQNLPYLHSTRTSTTGS